MTLSLRIKTRTGPQVLSELTLQHTIKDLKEALSKLSQIPVTRLHILYGFPPKALDLSQDDVLLSTCSLNTGDTLIVEEAQQSTSPATNNFIVNEEPTRDCSLGMLMKKVVPADNSCLFSSVFFVLNGKVDESGSAIQWMRKQIAEIIAQDSITYNEGILGKTPVEYCAWIQDENSWGGAIELAILSNYYGVEIAVIDTINGIINRFGEDQKFDHRVFLIFDGIHYDPLYYDTFEDNNYQTIFPSDDVNLLSEAYMLAKEAKSSKQFTDVHKFTLKCLDCNQLLSGQVQAQQHAKSTGHTNFDEVM